MLPPELIGRSTDRLKDGPPLVSANFVIPYPPGFPIMVPGQVITREIIDFMRKLDVKEIHGFNASRWAEAHSSCGGRANGQGCKEQGCIKEMAS